MIDETELTRRLTATLRARAEQETRPLGHFDPERSEAAVLTLAEAPSARRRLRRPVVLAAAVAAVVGAAAVAWAAVPSDDTGDGDVATAVPPGEPDSVRPQFPDGLVAPTAPMPGGMSLWVVDWRSQWGDESTDVDPGSWTQLFAEAGDPEAMVLIDHRTAGDPSNANPTGGQPVTVRGHDGMVGQYGDGAYDLSSLYWQEGGSLFAAPFRGMTVDDAVAAVDALRERSDGRPGFDVPADASLGLLGEVLDPVAPAPTTSYVYASAPPTSEGPAELVYGEAQATTGGTTTAYLHGWLVGERADDGTVVTSLPQINQLAILRPDGQTATAEGPSGTVPRQVLEEIVQSVRPHTAGELGDLWSEVSARVADLPVMASADLPSGTVELHGVDGIPMAGCLRLAAGTTCQYITTPSRGSERLTVGLDVGGAWYVVVATQIEGTTLSHDVPFESGTGGGWDFHLARPADGIDSVDVADDSDTGQTLYRPLGA